MWSPKLQKDGKAHFSYEFMKKLRPGDIVFSYANAVIAAVGVAQTHCYSFPKPIEFGNAGSNWSDEGWKVDVAYRKLEQPVRTMDHIQKLRKLLPSTKSPIKQDTGGANQAYLFQIELPFAKALAQLIDNATVLLVSQNVVAENSDSFKTIDAQLEVWGNRIETQIANSTDISDTDKDQLIRARRGQGKFRNALLSREHSCRVTGISNKEHLVASHIKPWRSADNRERLDPENGFMLTPSIDHLFDKGFISFENDGSILLADVADRGAMEKFRVIGSDAPANIGALSHGQKTYLDWHRESILLA